MRKVRIFEHTSLDGVIQPGAPDETSDYANGGWMAPYRSPGGADAIVEAQGENFDLLLGRRTYDMWSKYWPTVKGGLFADKLNAATKYVATHRPDGLSWGPVGNLGPDAIEGIRQLKTQDGPDLIVWGSASVTSVLLEQGLVDELVLIVYPILLGRGKRFFSDNAAPRELTLVSSKAFSSGRREQRATRLPHRPAF